MDDEMREALNDLNTASTMKADEFTTEDAAGLWQMSYNGAQKRLKGLAVEGAVTKRKAYDPRCCRQVSAYKKV